MFVLLVALLLLAIFSAFAMYFSPKEESTDAEKTTILPTETDEECCGVHEVCEVDLKKLSEDIIYFEDEELDVFKNIDEKAYKDEDIEQFREVLYTLKQQEINDWLHSLELRKIALPDILKAEIRMLLVG